MDDLDVVTVPEQIFRELLKSKEAGTVIGISSPVLGGFTHLTGVEDIVVDDALDVYIIFQPCDTSGYFFSTRKVKLDKIHFVKPFKSRFENLWAEKKSTAVEGAVQRLQA